MSVTQAKKPEVILLSSDRLESADANLIKLVEFMGGAVTKLGLGQSTRLSPGACVVAHARTLAQAHDLAHLLHELPRDGGRCFFYGFDSSPEHAEILSKLTSGSINGVQPATSPDQPFAVPASARDFCRQFTGLTFGKADPACDSFFVEKAAGSAHSTLISLGQKPFLVRLHNAERMIFLLASRTVADLDTPCLSSSLMAFFSKLAPVIMFLRYAFQDRLWHNDNPRACFIIDDPLLKPRHGFLNYKDLLALMAKERFSTSIAFIPWNYRRSQKRVADMLAPPASGYSLCVHGCDHTAGEFGETNAEVLREKAARALAWMARHRDLSGLPFDKVMVFPGGVFSAEALKTLASSGYLAAVNSTSFPVGSNGLTLRLRELLDVAVMRFSNFPLFVRRYPKEVAEIAFDLLLGRPALLVEHHEYFREGYEAIARVVREVNAAEEHLEWTGLEEICSAACLKRVEGSEVHVRFYCDRFRLRNTEPGRRTFVLWRRQPTGTPDPVISINGQPAEFEQQGESLKCSMTLEPGRIAEIAIQRPAQGSTSPSIAPRPLKRASVFARRHLCEFRDNYVQTNRLLNRMAGQARRMLSGTRKSA
jgi:hypothetical protein